MELFEIRSARDLRANPPGTRPPGSFSYEIDRHLFIAAHSARQHAHPQATAPLTLMTTAAEQIWMNDRESAQVAAAIRSARSTVTLD